MKQVTLTPKAQAMAHHRHWYAHAWDTIEAKAYELGVCPDRMAAVLAISSPRVHVSRNWALAVQWVRTGQVTGCLDMVRRNLQQYEDTGRISGPKVGAYYRALTGDTEAVVLDIWMARLFNVDPLKLSTKQVREPLQDRVRRCARRLDWEPRQVQAALWAWSMNKHGHNVASY